METWEKCKENFQPVREGRSVKELEAAEPTRLKHREHAYARQNLYRAIRKYQGDDPLQPWLQLVKWEREVHQAGSRELLEALEKLTRELLEHGQYKDDRRYLRMWLLYADHVNDPEQIFKMLQERGIGQNVALFYRAYAQVLESSGEVERAAEVFQEGIRRGVDTEVLQKHFSDFQARLTRSVESHIASGTSVLPQQQTAARQAFTALSKGSQASYRPMASQPTAHMATMPAKPAPTVRAGAAPSHAAGNVPLKVFEDASDRPPPFGAARPASTSGGGSRLGGDMYARGQGETASAALQRALGRPGLPGRPGAPPGDVPAFMLRHLPGAAERKKENTVDSQPLRAAGLLPQGGVAPADGLPAALDVYVDEEVSAVPKAPLRRAGATALRARLDGAAPEHELIVSDPLLRQHQHGDAGNEAPSGSRAPADRQAGDAIEAGMKENERRGGGLVGPGGGMPAFRLGAVDECEQRLVNPDAQVATVASAEGTGAGEGGAACGRSARDARPAARPQRPRAVAAEEAPSLQPPSDTEAAGEQVRVCATRSLPDSRHDAARPERQDANVTTRRSSHRASSSGAPTGGAARELSDAVRATAASRGSGRSRPSSRESHPIKLMLDCSALAPPLGTAAVDLSFEEARFEWLGRQGLLPPPHHGMSNFARALASQHASPPQGLDPSRDLPAASDGAARGQAPRPRLRREARVESAGADDMRSCGLPQQDLPAAEPRSVDDAAGDRQRVSALPSPGSRAELAGSSPVSAGVCKRCGSSRRKHLTSPLHGMGQANPRTPQQRSSPTDGAARDSVSLTTPQSGDAYVPVTGDASACAVARTDDSRRHRALLDRLDDGDLQLFTPEGAPTKRSDGDEAVAAAVTLRTDTVAPNARACRALSKSKEFAASACGGEQHASTAVPPATASAWGNAQSAGRHHTRCSSDGTLQAPAFEPTVTNLGISSALDACFADTSYSLPSAAPDAHEQYEWAAASHAGEDTVQLIDGFVGLAFSDDLTLHGAPVATTAHQQQQHTTSRRQLAQLPAELGRGDGPAARPHARRSDGGLGGSSRALASRRKSLEGGRRSLEGGALGVRGAPDSARRRSSRRSLGRKSLLGLPMDFAIREDTVIIKFDEGKTAKMSMPVFEANVGDDSDAASPPRELNSPSGFRRPAPSPDFPVYEDTAVFQAQSVDERPPVLPDVGIYEDTEVLEQLRKRSHASGGQAAAAADAGAPGGRSASQYDEFGVYEDTEVLQLRGGVSLSHEAFVRDDPGVVRFRGGAAAAVDDADALGVREDTEVLQLQWRPQRAAGPGAAGDLDEREAVYEDTEVLRGGVGGMGALRPSAQSPRLDVYEDTEVLRGRGGEGPGAELGVREDTEVALSRSGGAVARGAREGGPLQFATGFLEPQDAFPVYEDTEVLQRGDPGAIAARENAGRDDAPLLSQTGLEGGYGGSTAVYEDTEVLQLSRGDAPLSDEFGVYEDTELLPRARPDALEAPACVLAFASCADAADGQPQSACASRAATAPELSGAMGGRAVAPELGVYEDTEVLNLPGVSGGRGRGDAAPASAAAAQQALPPVQHPLASCFEGEPCAKGKRAHVTPGSWHEHPPHDRTRARRESASPAGDVDSADTLELSDLAPLIADTLNASFAGLPSAEFSADFPGVPHPRGSADSLNAGGTAAQPAALSRDGACAGDVHDENAPCSSRGGASNVLPGGLGTLAGDLQLGLGPHAAKPFSGAADDAIAVADVRSEAPAGLHVRRRLLFGAQSAGEGLSRPASPDVTRLAAVSADGLLYADDGGDSDDDGAAVALANAAAAAAEDGGDEFDVWTDDMAAQCATAEASGSGGGGSDVLAAAAAALCDKAASLLRDASERSPLAPAPREDFTVLPTAAGLGDDAPEASPPQSPRGGTAQEQENAAARAPVAADGLVRARAGAVLGTLHDAPQHVILSPARRAAARTPGQSPLSRSVLSHGSPVPSEAGAAASGFGVPRVGATERSPARRPPLAPCAGPSLSLASSRGPSGDWGALSDALQSSSAGAGVSGDGAGCPPRNQRPTDIARTRPGARAALGTLVDRTGPPVATSADFAGRGALDPQPRCHGTADLSEGGAKGYRPHGGDRGPGVRVLGNKARPIDAFSDGGAAAQAMAALPPVSSWPGACQVTDAAMATALSSLDAPGARIALPSLVVRVQRCLGAGGFARVYAASVERSETPDVAPEDVVALKVAHPAAAWEFRVQSELRRRLPSADAAAFAPARLLFVDAAMSTSVMLGPAFTQGTLLDLVNAYKLDRAQIDETVTVYLALQLLRALFGLQRARVIHGDIKLDNVLVNWPPPPDARQRAPRDAAPSVAWSRAAEADSRGPWGRPGGCLRVIDFGRSIDLDAHPDGTLFVGQTTTKGMQCPEMLSGKPWHFCHDTFCVAATVHTLLFAEYLQVERVELLGTKQMFWRPKRSLPRTPRRPLWDLLFKTLLNCPLAPERPDLAPLITLFETELEDSERVDPRLHASLLDACSRLEGLIRRD